MFSLILSIIFFILFIFLSIASLNYILRRMIDNVLSKNENFENFKNEEILDNCIINPLDECKKMDLEGNNNLNFQNAVNIPLSQNYYKDYIGYIYMNEEEKNNNELLNGKYCLKKSKLLYDGIWESNIINESPYKYEKWNLTNDNLTDGYYCSNKLIEINKDLPLNYIDKSSTPDIIGGNYYTYFNDTNDDIFDKEIKCFSSIFNHGITEDLKKNN
jgi:hypothetical protein